MKNWLVFLLIGLATCALHAQPSSELTTSAPDPLQSELDRIQAERGYQEARYANEEAACYQRFAVNDCLREVRVRRRLTMEDLRRQEIAVNDVQRRQKGAEEIQRLEEKSSLQNQQEAADRREAFRTIKSGWSGRNKRKSTSNKLSKIGFRPHHGLTATKAATDRLRKVGQRISRNTKRSSVRRRRAGRGVTKPWPTRLASLPPSPCLPLLN